jgi:hypothetical protein
MPTNRRHRRKLPRQGSVLTPGIRGCLEEGHNRLGELGVGLSPEQLEMKLRELWAIHGEEVTRVYIAQYPGRRPACWWMFSSPVPRPEIIWTGDAIGGDPYANDRERQRVREVAILLRHNLLTAAEQDALEDPVKARLITPKTKMWGSHQDS